MKQIIKLTESDLHKIIKMAANKIVKENHAQRKPLREWYREGDGSPVLISDETIEDNKAEEIAQDNGYETTDEAAAEWFRNIDVNFEEGTMPKYANYIDEIPELNASLYHDFYGGYYFLTSDNEPSPQGMTYESIIRRSIKESINRLMKEDAGGGATNCANTMQTGCGKAPLGTNPEAGQYTTPLGADEETKDRHPGFSVDGKAKWNKNGGTTVMRRQMYNPKSGKKK